ncbi:MAG: HAD family hydrolase [Acidobacteriota bacterium]
MPNPTKYDCIIFDMDGTLTQTNQLIYDAFNLVAEKYLGRRLTPEEIVSYFGPPEKEAVQNMIGPEHIEEAMVEYYRFYNERHNSLASLYPGILEILRFLHEKGVLVALFTGKGRRTTDISLELFEIERYFDITITGDDVGEFKPSGDGIRKILSRFNLVPSRVLMVGDAVADVLAAREAGTDVASVVWDSYGRHEVLKLNADYVFENVQELHDWLVSLYHSSGDAQ